MMTEKKGGDGTETGKELRNILVLFQCLVSVTCHKIPYYVITTIRYTVYFASPLTVTLYRELTLSPLNVITPIRSRDRERESERSRRDRSNS